MKHTDFEIGTKFYTVTGQYWLCTDVGTRAILAIELDPELDKNWFKGPPYAVKEVVFNEKEIQRCFRNEEDIKNILEQSKNKNHPEYSAEVTLEILKASYKRHDYPHQELFRIDRVDENGEIYHPYAAEKEDDKWIILVYLSFTKEFKRVKESVFIGLETSTEEDLLKRKNAFI